MRGGFLGDGILEIRVGDDVVGYKHGVREAQDEEGDGRGEDVGLGNREEDEDGLDGGADKEEGAQGEIAMEGL